MRIRDALPLLLLLGACTDGPTVRRPDRPTGVVDSLFPPAEELRRFQASLPDTVTALSGGAPGRDELVAHFVAALEAGDSTAFAPLALTTAEFGWLWFPESRFIRPPYQTKPGLLWFQMQNASSRGINRAFRRFGGRPVGFERYDCPGEPVVEGQSRTWEGCTVTIRPEGTDRARTLRLFGSILERGGVWKFVGYGNDL